MPRSPSAPAAPGGLTSPLQHGQVAPYTIYYDFKPDFGDYLRRMREAKGLSLREAADHLCVPYSYVQRLETGGRASKPDLTLLERLAVLFSRPLSEMEERAGIRREPLLDPDHTVHEQFKALVLHPNLRPPGMTEEWLESFSVRQKRQIVQLLRQLGEHIKTGGKTPNEILLEEDLLPTVSQS